MAGTLVFKAVNYGYGIYVDGTRYGNNNGVAVTISVPTGSHTFEGKRENAFPTFAVPQLNVVVKEGETVNVDLGEIADLNYPPAITGFPFFFTNVNAHINVVGVDDGQNKHVDTTAWSLKNALLCNYNSGHPSDIFSYNYIVSTPGYVSQSGQYSTHGTNQTAAFYQINLILVSHSLSIALTVNGTAPDSGLVVSLDGSGVVAPITMSVPEGNHIIDVPDAPIFRGVKCRFDKFTETSP